LESSKSTDGINGDDRLLEAGLEPGPVERGRWWRMLDLIDGKGEVVLEEATAVMFWVKGREM
jgi:hypothetical protein